MAWIRLSQKGKKLTDEHKRKLSIRFSGEKNNMYGKGYKLKGRKHSEESIQKMSNSMKGEKNPQYGKKKTKNISIGKKKPRVNPIIKGYY